MGEYQGVREPPEDDPTGGREDASRLDNRPWRLVMEPPPPIFGLVPAWLSGFLQLASTVLITVAMAALGIKTSLPGMLAIGIRPVALLTVETLFILALVVGLLLVLQ